MFQNALRLPGAVYCGVVDPFTGEVVTDTDTKPPLTAEVVEWAAEVAISLDASTAHELDDIMITSRGHHHLVRRVAPADGRPVLVVFVLDRGVSNLALARRELAAFRWPDHEAAEAPLLVTRLPRRSVSARSTHRWPALPVPRPPQPSEPAVLRQRWANDTSTMRQLLVGLRSLR